LKPTSIKLQAENYKLQNYGCNGNLLCNHSVVEKKLHFLWRVMERRWKRNVVSLVFSDSGDTPANLLCHLPGVSIVYGLKMCVLANLEYLSILFSAVLLAAAPGLVAVLPMWDSA